MAKSNPGYVRLPGGLVIPADAAAQFVQNDLGKLGKRKPKGPVAAKQIVTRTQQFGMEVVHYAGSHEDVHKLDPDARKERREDNKAMKRSRQMHRKRKKHGR